MNKDEIINSLKRNAFKSHPLNIEKDAVSLDFVMDLIEEMHTEQKLNKHGVSGKQPDQKTIRAAAVNYSEKHREHDRWMKTRYYCFKDFQAGAQWALSTVAGVCSGSDKTT